MSWCGRCFTSQADSDFDSDDDGEYEYFVNSNYICKRKKTDIARDGDSTLQGKSESTAELTTMSESEASRSSWQNPSSLSRYRGKGHPSCSKTDDTSQTSSCETEKKSSTGAAQLAGARIWQVGVATISGPNPQYDPFCKPIQPLCPPSTSGSDHTTEIVFKQSSQQDSPTKILAPSHIQGITVVTNKNMTPSSTANSKISYSSGHASKLKTRPGFIQRLFGRSGKSVLRRKSGAGESQPSGFKESMEQPSPSIATSTLYWTVRVKMK